MIVWSGRLRGASTLGCPSLEREERPAIVQRKARPGRDDAAAEPLVDALNQRDDIAVLVDCREIDRVAAGRVGQAVQLPRARRRQPPASGSISRARVSACALLSIAVVPASRETRIADVAQHVRIGQLLRFDHHVQRGSALKPVLTPGGTAPSGSSMSSAAIPCVLGGSSYTVQPRYVVEIGSTHSGSELLRDRQRRSCHPASPTISEDCVGNLAAVDTPAAPSRAMRRSDWASAGFLNTSPARGARPSGR